MNAPRGKPRKPRKAGEDPKPEKPAKPMSPKRVLNARVTLHTLLDEAVRKELIPSNPVAKIRPPKQNPERVRAFTTEQMQALTTTAHGHRLEALFALAWQTGMRMGELLGLRWEDVDFEGGTARIQRTAATTGGAVFFQDTRTTTSERTIALSPETLAALRTHRARQAEERLAAGAAWRDLGLTFPTSKGTAIHPSAMERTWYSVRDKAGVSAYGFHSLRHGRLYGSMPTVMPWRTTTFSEYAGQGLRRCGAGGCGRPETPATGWRAWRFRAGSWNDHR